MLFTPNARSRGVGLSGVIVLFCFAVGRKFIRIKILRLYLLITLLTFLNHFLNHFILPRLLAYSLLS